MTAITYAYLGKPGAMRQIPIPRRGFDSAPSHGESVFTLLSGGTAKVGNLYRKRTFTLPYDVTSAESDVLLGFYEGIYGTGPWRFVDPTARNMLELDTSICGGRLQADDGWTAASGTLTASAVGNGPTGVDSGVLTWTSLVAGGGVRPGLVSTTADVVARAPVYIPTEPVSVSLWAKANTTSTGHSLMLAGFSSTGALTVTSIAATMNLTTTWTRFTASAAANNAALSSAVFVLPRIVLGGTVPTSVSIAGAQLEYADAVSTWQPGFGCPNVTIPSSPGRSASVPGWRAHTLTLAEV